MLAIALPLWRRLPALAAAPDDVSYLRLLASMLALLRQERVLQIRGMLALLMFAAFNIFWSALVLPLSAPPFMFSHTVIGAFGLAGVAGRSEEHTSELQSLMRSSYAVFRLTKQTTQILSNTPYPTMFMTAKRNDKLVLRSYQPVRSP